MFTIDRCLLAISKANLSPHPKPAPNAPYSWADLLLDQLEDHYNIDAFVVFGPSVTVGKRIDRIEQVQAADPLGEE